MTSQDPILNRLRDVVAKREAAGEQRMPPERELARQLKTSRGTLRRALDLLEAEGILWRHVGQGTFIGNQRPAMAGQGRSRITRFTNPDEVMEARLVIEPQLAALAAIRASAEDISRMDYSLRKSEAATTTATFELWDSRLHRAIAEAARNRMLLVLFDQLNAVRNEDLWGRLKEASVTRPRRTGYMSQHRQLVDAIRRRDAAEAQRIMQAHLSIVKNDLLSPQA